MEIVSLIIAILALLFSLITYIIHDIKIKKQEAQINEYEIRAFKQEEEDRKKAFVECSTHKNFNSKKLDYIRVENIGKSTAKNIQIKVNDIDVSFTESDDFFPYPELMPNHYFEIYFFLGGIDKFGNVTIIWDDEYKKGNEASQKLNFRP